MMVKYQIQEGLIAFFFEGLYQKFDLPFGYIPKQVTKFGMEYTSKSKFTPTFLKTSEELALKQLEYKNTPPKDTLLYDSTVKQVMARIF